MSFMMPKQPKPVALPPEPVQRQNPDDPTLANAQSLVGTPPEGIVSADPVQAMKRKASVVKASLIGGSRAS